MASYTHHFPLWDNAASTYWLEGRACHTTGMDVMEEVSVALQGNKPHNYSTAVIFLTKLFQPMQWYTGHSKTYW